MANKDFTAFTPETWAQFEKYKSALAAAAEDTGKFRKGVDSLLEVVASAGPKAAEFAKIFQGGLPGVVATIGVETIKTYFDWVEKALDKQRQMTLELQEFNKFQREVIRAGGDMLENAKKTAEAIAGAEAKTHSLSENLKSFENKAKRFNLAQSDSLQNQTDLRHADNSASTAQIQLLEAMGEISPEQAEQMRIEAGRKENLATIQDRLTKDESNYYSAKSDYDEELKIVGGKAAFSPQAIGAATDALSQAQGKYNQALMLAGPEGQAQLDELDRKIKENKAQWKAHGTEWNVGTNEIKDGEFWSQDQDLNKQQAQLVKEIQDARANLDTYRNGAADAQQRLDDLKGLADRFNEYEARLGELEQKWRDDLALAPGLAAAANEQAGAASLTAQIKGGRLNRDDFLKAVLTDAYGIEASHVQSGKDFDQTQAQTLAALQNLLEKVHLNSVSILQVITAGAQKHETLEQVLDDLSAQLNAQQSQIKNSGNISNNS